eukprot:4788756-Pyramimonas_sp.AAC.1
MIDGVWAASGRSQHIQQCNMMRDTILLPYMQAALPVRPSGKAAERIVVPDEIHTQLLHSGANQQKPLSRILRHKISPKMKPASVHTSSFGPRR